MSALKTWKKVFFVFFCCIYFSESQKIQVQVRLLLWLQVFLIIQSFMAEDDSVCVGKLLDTVHTEQITL